MQGAGDMKKFLILLLAMVGFVGVDIYGLDCDRDCSDYHCEGKDCATPGYWHQTNSDYAADLPGCEKYCQHRGGGSATGFTKSGGDKYCKCARNTRTYCPNTDYWANCPGYFTWHYASWKKSAWHYDLCPVGTYNAEQLDSQGKRMYKCVKPWDAVSLQLMQNYWD